MEIPNRLETEDVAWAEVRRRLLMWESSRRCCGSNNRRAELA